VTLPGVGDRARGAALGRLVDRFPWVVPFVSAVQLVGPLWVLLIAALTVMASLEAEPVLVLVLAGVVTVRALWCWSAARAAEQHMERLTGDPRVYHDDWLYRAGEPAEGGLRLVRCSRCGTRLRRGSSTVEAVARLKESTAGRPQPLQLGDSTSHLGYVFCGRCGNEFRRRQGDEAERERRLLERLEIPLPAPALEPGSKALRNASLVALAASLVALVVPEKLDPVVLVLLLVVLFGSIFGLAVARQGWQLYARNHALLGFTALTLAGAAVAAGAGVWGMQRPEVNPVPGAVSIKSLVVAAGPADARTLAGLTELEERQDFLGMSLVGRYDVGAPASWWSSQGAQYVVELSELGRRHRAQAARLREPSLRARYAQIASARSEWGGELGALRAAMTDGRTGEAKLAELRARIAGDRAHRLRATLFVQDR
jgi:hypothetical protein